MGDKGVFEQVVTSAMDWPAVEADIAARQVGGGRVMIYIIGYAYEADVHCADCAKVRFNGRLDLAVDAEGNPVHPIFSTDEKEHPLHCADCGLLIP